MLRQYEIADAGANPSFLDDVRTFVRDSVTIAKYSIWMFSRYRGWFLNLAIGPFLAIAPFVFLADTLVGQGNPLEGQYFDDLGYASYVGFLVVPLMAVNLSNTVFSWISGLIRQEQWTGTLERVLVSVQFPSTLFIGRALAHVLYMMIFVVATLGLVSIWVRPDFDIDPLAGFLVVVLHLLTVYGMAFMLSSAFMRITDSWTVQTVLTRTLLAILAGATFPITLFPEWLQIVARVFPFTWLFDMERRSLLRAETVGDMALDFGVVVAMTVVMWTLGFVLLGRELRHTKRTGTLGGF
jgi:ABC-2 type transport system permease protein